MATTDYAPVRDIPLLITSSASRSERRITPTWSLSTLKRKLEPITGIPPSVQRLTLLLPDQKQEVPLAAEDEDATLVGNWPLQQGGEIKVTSTAPLPTHLLSTSTADEPPQSNPLPLSSYAQKSGTVLSYKRAHKIGRFDPDLPARNAEKAAASWEEVKEKGIEAGKRCAVVDAEAAVGGGGRQKRDLTRRGTVRYVGKIAELPGPPAAAWIGVELDEPTGRGDGSVSVPASRHHDDEDVGDDDEESGWNTATGGKVEEGGKVRYFQCKDKHAVFVRGERVIVGDFPVLEIGGDGFGDGEEGLEDSDMEEL